MSEPSRSLSKAAEQVRQFNHDTIATGDDWQYPPQANRAIGSLAQLVRMLPQAIEQTLLPVERTHMDGRVTADSGDPARAVAILQAAVSNAANLARDLSVALDHMHSAASPLGLDTRGLREFDEDGDW